jgi:hypothetical protein
MYIDDVSNTRAQLRTTKSESLDFWNLKESYQRRTEDPVKQEDPVQQGSAPSQSAYGGIASFILTLRKIMCNLECTMRRKAVHRTGGSSSTHEAPPHRGGGQLASFIHRDR